MIVQETRQMIRPFCYDDFMHGEGIPIVEEVAGVADVPQLPRKPWARTGGAGTFIQLMGTVQAEEGIYVAEIPGVGALNPEIRRQFEEELSKDGIECRMPPMTYRNEPVTMV